MDKTELPHEACAACAVRRKLDNLDVDVARERMKATIAAAAIAHAYVGDPSKSLHPGLPRSKMSRASLDILEATARAIAWDIRQSLWEPD